MPELFLFYDHPRCGGGRFVSLSVADPQDGEDDQEKEQQRRDREGKMGSDHEGILRYWR